MTKCTTYLAATLGALVFALPATGQGNGQGNGQYARVLGERAQAGAVLSEQVERARARSELESALTKRGEALNDVHAAPKVTELAGETGFARDAAASGAGVTLALVLGAFGIAFLVRRGRGPASEAA
jgi:hypothetical protein